MRNVAISQPSSAMAVPIRRSLRKATCNGESEQGSRRDEGVDRTGKRHGAR